MGGVMYRKLLLILMLFSGIMLNSCNKKSHPSKTIAMTKADSVAAVKKVKETEKKLFPKVIVVNDSAARRSVDGRLYYDVLGHRYWRNKKDGKYYLFNKSMYKDEAFKP
jgi:S-adenosylhomocysteine hydrolase